METQRQTNSNSITVHGQKPLLHSSMHMDMDRIVILLQMFTDPYTACRLIPGLIVIRTFNIWCTKQSSSYVYCCSNFISPPHTHTRTASYQWLPKCTLLIGIVIAILTSENGCYNATNIQNLSRCTMASSVTLNWSSFMWETLDLERYWYSILCIVWFNNCEAGLERLRVCIFPSFWCAIALAIATNYIPNIHESSLFWDTIRVDTWTKWRVQSVAW